LLDKTAALLDEREKTHGDYRRVSEIAQDLKGVIRDAEYDRLSNMQRESLDLIFTKIARIISGDASNLDHWKDIAGYALLPTRFS
jgi:hypothetical protein